MQLEERVVGDVTVLALSGRMTRDQEVRGLEAEGLEPGARRAAQARVEFGGSLLYG